ncbi:hypothetical protein [Rhodococcus sp. NPDC057529]|uniref:hypothetical protein n=1 Tax=Rhodococcus sp. NPDC057529 TaxID=3346158 RepID=UPI0036711CEB
MGILETGQNQASRGVDDRGVRSDGCLHVRLAEGNDSIAAYGDRIRGATGLIDGIDRRTGNDEIGFE